MGEYGITTIWKYYCVNFEFSGSDYSLNPEEVGHASSIVTRCLVIMAKIKWN